MNAYINTDTHTYIYDYICIYPYLYTYIYIYPYRYIQTTNNINLWQIYFKRGLLSLLMLFFAHCGRCRSNYGQMGGSSGQLWVRDLRDVWQIPGVSGGKNLGKKPWEKSGDHWKTWEKTYGIHRKYWWSVVIDGFQPSKTWEKMVISGVQPWQMWKMGAKLPSWKTTGDNLWEFTVDDVWNSLRT